ncbi:MAG: hypothetical protein CW716_12170 [Candidatus Bathyarchaeum sp.]|nr:MAG: hypothetical protein CW716_12170 [Candidatus Bathyarchaeum sp.]
MKNDQLAEVTIKNTVRRLKFLAKSCNLNKPEEIITFLGEMKGKNSYKDTVAHAYNRYVRYNGLKWKMPKIKKTSQPPYVPTTEEITILCSDSGEKYCLIFSILKDTGIRPIEMERTQLKWVDLEKGILQVETAKYGLGRNLKLKPSTLEMLKHYIKKGNYRANDRIFPKTKSLRRNMIKIRDRIAKKLHRPEFKKICLYSFRHYFASKEYQKCRSYVHVMKKMGHRRIEQTMTYIHLITDGYDDCDFTTATAETVNEVCKLIEDGFEYVTEIEGVKVFRKRK